MRPLSFLAFLPLLAACSPGLEASFANAGPAGDGVGGFLTVAARGQPVGAGNVDVDVWTRAGDGDWVAAADVEVNREGNGLMDVVVVADNSGSIERWEEAIVEAVDHFGHVLLARAHEDRLGLVRVSTTPSVIQELTADSDEFAEAAEALHVSNGWTALWAGLRMANEVLERGALDAQDNGICVDRAHRAILVFTDAGDNNSAGEQGTPVDEVTTFEDVLGLSIHGVPTAIHTVSVSPHAEVSTLHQLATETGGQARAIHNYGGLTGALHGAADSMRNHVPLCFQPAACAHDQALVEVRTGAGQSGDSVSFEVAIPDTCD